MTPSSQKGRAVWGREFSRPGRGGGGDPIADDIPSSPQPVGRRRLQTELLVRWAALFSACTAAVHCAMAGLRSCLALVLLVIVVSTGSEVTVLPVPRGIRASQSSVFVSRRLISSHEWRLTSVNMDTPDVLVVSGKSMLSIDNLNLHSCVAINSRCVVLR